MTSAFEEAETLLHELLLEQDQLPPFNLMTHDWSSAKYGDGVFVDARTKHGLFLIRLAAAPQGYPHSMYHYEDGKAYVIHTAALEYLSKAARFNQVSLMSVADLVHVD